MSDQRDNSTPHRTAVEDALTGREHLASTPEETETQAHREMPTLGKFRNTPVRWLTPLLVVVLTGLGAVWTIHGFLARHEAASRAHRDALAQSSIQGRVFEEPLASDRAPVAPPIVVAPALKPPSEIKPSVVPRRPVTPTRSYYDAPLLVTSSSSTQVEHKEYWMHEPASEDAQEIGAQTGMPVTSASGRERAIASQSAGGTLAQALMPTSTPRVQAAMLGNRSLILAQGAKIDCVGDTAFDSTEAGLASCTVTKNVYSDDGRVVLIERGSQIISQYRSNLSPGQKRAFILSARVETPRGVTVEIDSPAADALGRMGVDGYVDKHWGERIGAAMMLGITQDAIGYLATRGGNSNGSVIYENTQQQGNDMATRVLESTINIAPTLTQNQGAEFTIVIARDLDFSTVYALEPERMP